MKIVESHRSEASNGLTLLFVTVLRGWSGNLLFVISRRIARDLPGAFAFLECEFGGEMNRIY